MANGSGYFDHLENIEYQGQSIPNIFFRLKVDKNLSQSENFELTRIPNGMPVENISLRKYSDQKLWWFVMLYNGLIDPYNDLSLTTQEVEEYGRLLAQDLHGAPTQQEIYDAIAEVSRENETKGLLQLPQKDAVVDILSRGISIYFEE